MYFLYFFCLQKLSGKFVCVFDDKIMFYQCYVLIFGVIGDDNEDMGVYF